MALIDEIREQPEVAARLLAQAGMADVTNGADHMVIGTLSADDQITFEDSSIQEVVTGYTRESGVRQLEREIGRLARKVARKIAAGEIEAYTVGRDQVAELLGRPKVHPEHAAEHDGDAAHRLQDLQQRRHDPSPAKPMKAMESRPATTSASAAVRASMRRALDDGAARGATSTGAVAWA